MLYFQRKYNKYYLNNLEELPLFSKQFVTCASWTRFLGFESLLSDAAALLRGDRLLKSFHYLVPDHRSEWALHLIHLGIV